MDAGLGAYVDVPEWRRRAHVRRVDGAAVDPPRRWLGEPCDDPRSLARELAGRARRRHEGTEPAVRLRRGRVDPPPAPAPDVLGRLEGRHRLSRRPPSGSRAPRPRDRWFTGT